MSINYSLPQETHSKVMIDTLASAGLQVPQGSPLE